MYVISGKYTSFLSVQYILYSKTLVYFIWYVPFINIIRILAFIKCHIQKCIPDCLCYLFLNCSWIKDTFLGLGEDQARCIL